jgi:hypothetical protein
VLIELASKHQQAADSLSKSKTIRSHSQRLYPARTPGGCHGHGRLGVHVGTADAIVRHGYNRAARSLLVQPGKQGVLSLATACYQALVQQS